MVNALTLEEFKQCAKVLAASTGRSMPPEQAEAYLILLQDIPFPALYAACLRAVQETKQNFIPSVGVIRELAAERQHGIYPQAAEEWESVRKAIRRFGYMNKADGLRSLSPRARQAAMSIGWDVLCDSENIAVQAGQFRMAYEAAAKREIEHRKISPELRPRIEAGEQLKLHNEVRDVVRNLADKFKSPDDAA